MNIRKLIVMQEVPRNVAQLAPMIRYVAEGGYWTEDAVRQHAESLGRTAGGMIYIPAFPDGAEMIHDGHHRVLATFLAGRFELRRDEYVYEPWSYESYTTVNWDVGYVTPHDPKTEVRLPDFMPFKNRVFELAETEGKEAAEAYVWSHRDLYCKPRTIFTVEQMAAAYLESINAQSEAAA